MPPKKLRIMIIDDEECIRDSLAFHLEDLGHEIVTYDKPENCPVFSRHACGLDGACADIILVDFNMPGVNGLDFLRRLTRHGCLTLPPNRIMMTGDVTPELEAEIRRMGCRVIQKPLRLDTLEEIIVKARAFISSDRVLADLE